MKFTFLFLFSNVIAASWIPSVQAAGLPFVKDFTVEAKESKKKQAPILVLFMSTSCPYCEIVLQDFLLPMQRDRAYDKRVILRQIETGSSAQLIDFLLAEDGILVAVTAQKPFEMGQSALQAAVKVLRSENVEKQMVLPGILFTRDKPDDLRAYKKTLETASD